MLKIVIFRTIFAVKSPIFLMAFFANICRKMSVLLSLRTLRLAFYKKLRTQKYAQIWTFFLSLACLCALTHQNMVTWRAPYRSRVSLWVETAIKGPKVCFFSEWKVSGTALYQLGCWPFFANGILTL